MALRSLFVYFFSCSIIHGIHVIRATKNSTSRTGLDLDHYNSYEDMITYIRHQADKCSACTIESIGKSGEGRDMLILKIGDFGKDRKGVWIDAGSHAREWVTPATVLFFIEKITQGIASDDVTVMEILDNYNFYILPSANPDGYEYSRTKDRQWRKTMSGYRDAKTCFGVDANRNWDFHWGEFGANRNSCSINYLGGKPFSERETRNVARYVWRHRDQLLVFLTLHSYGQFWLTPWAYTRELPEDYDDLIEAAGVAVKELAKVYGTKYRLGSFCRAMYGASGVSTDWAKGVAGIKYTYTVELRDRRKGKEDIFYRFKLPPEQIRPTGEETWAGVRALLRRIRDIESRNTISRGARADSMGYYTLPIHPSAPSVRYVCLLGSLLIGLVLLPTCLLCRRFFSLC